MNRPKRELMAGGLEYEVEYEAELNKYINYLELRIERLTEGLDDIVITLQNMQRDGKEE